MPDLVYIQYLNGPRSGEKMRLEQLPVLFGRTSDSAIVLGWDGLVSSRHFEIFQDEGSYFLRDAGSRNGTRVNGLAVLRQRLYHGDLIEVGNSKIQVGIVSEAPSSQEPVAVLADRKSADGAIAPASLDSGKKRINPFDSLKMDEPASNEPASDEPASDEPQKASSVPIIIEQLRIRIIDAPPGGAATSESGRLLWLSPGQAMTFGRSPRCDGAVTSDAFLSSTHFKVICESHQCLVEDLGSTSGTLLNGVRIDHANVFHGDLLLAGKTEFQIEVDGNQGPVVRRELEAAAKAKVAPVRKELPSTAPEALTLTREKCPSGLFVLKGILQDQLPLPALVDWIHANGKVFLVIDATRGTMPLPEDYDPATGQLFYWLPPELARNSPQLVSLDELPEWPNHVSDLLGNDGLVVLQSQLDKAGLLATFKTCLTGSSDSKKPFAGILGICWPSVMMAALKNQADDLANRLMSEVSLVITEGSDGKSYELFVRQPEMIDAILGMFDQRKIKYTINRVEDDGQ